MTIKPTLTQLIDGALAENAGYSDPDPKDDVILGTRLYYIGHHMAGCTKASLLANLTIPDLDMDMAITTAVGAGAMSLMVAVLKSPEWAMAILGLTPKDLVKGEFAELAEDWYENMPVTQVMEGDSDDSGL